MSIAPELARQRVIFVIFLMFGNMGSIHYFCAAAFLGASLSGFAVLLTVFRLVQRLTLASADPQFCLPPLCWP